jgi:hypothetical protein
VHDVRDTTDLIDAHHWALQTHREWKSRSRVNDLIANGKWHVVWNDLTGQDFDPLVENIYIEALEDKAYAAAGLVPQVFVGPSTGTRLDRGEKQAQDKRKVFLSYMQASGYDRLRVKWLLDYYEHGAAYGFPWLDWNAEPKQPFFLRHDPRHAYPLSHDSQGNLSGVFFAKQRRLVDVESEWGSDHGALQQIRTFRGQERLEGNVPVEELWYFDAGKQAVALYQASANELNSTKYQYQSPDRGTLDAGSKAWWLSPLEEHGLSRCPVVENKRPTHDGEYRGALDVMIPQLRVAQNLMARVMEDVEFQVGAPVLMEGIENPEDWGPHEIMEGDGSGNSKIEFVRQPINFEANQHIKEQLDSARRVGKFPQQRTGEAGASIVSAKGTQALQGSYNSEMAQAQRDAALMLRELLSVTAEYDVSWADTRKKVLGFDEGESFELSYNPSSMFKGDDYRVVVTFGGGLGMEQSQYMVQLATARNLGGMARRTFMQKSGLVANAIREEDEIFLETLTEGFAAFAMQQAEAGNVQPMVKAAEKVDDEKMTAREAVLSAIKEIYAIPAGGQGTPGPDPGPGDPLLQQRSLEAGGIPGNAEGLPQGGPGIGPELSKALPASVGRALASAAPGSG